LASVQLADILNHQLPRIARVALNVKADHIETGIEQAASPATLTAEEVEGQRFHFRPSSFNLN
jgi:hypothetical protein